MSQRSSAVLFVLRSTSYPIKVIGRKPRMNVKLWKSMNLNKYSWFYCQTIIFQDKISFHVETVQLYKIVLFHFFKPYQFEHCKMLLFRVYREEKINPF